jgi:hypothetical protein
MRADVNLVRVKSKPLRSRALRRLPDKSSVPPGRLEGRLEIGAAHISLGGLVRREVKVFHEILCARGREKGRAERERSRNREGA